MKTADQLNIFLVDDDPFSLFMYQRHLNQSGYTRVRTFSNGDACLQELAENPDVIFIDHDMEGMSGMDLMKSVKRFIGRAHIVFLSGQENVDTVFRTLHQGAYEYIFKGDHDLEKISAVMKRISETRQPERPRGRGLLRKLFSFAA